MSANASTSASASSLLGVPWHRTPRSECGILGNALIAAAATRHVRDLAATIGEWQEMGPATLPDPACRERYRALLEVHRELTAAGEPIFARLQALGAASASDAVEGAPA